MDRYLDPSQFPKQASGGAAGPGRWPWERTPQADGKDLHLGAQGWLRQVRYAKEDIEDARGRIFSSFDGGVRSEFLETVRGRAGDYPEGKVTYQTGRFAMDQALRQLGGLADAHGNANVTANPGDSAVDRVTGDVEIQLGAAQFDGDRQRYLDWAKELQGAAAPQATAPEVAGLEKDLQDAQQQRRLAQATELSQVAQAAVPAAEQAFKATAFPFASLLAARASLALAIR